MNLPLLRTTRGLTAMALVGAGLAGGLAATLEVVGAPAARADSTPHVLSEPDSAGGLTIYNSAGTAITTGAVATLVHDYVDGAKTTLGTGGTKATLFAYTPVVGQSPAQWAGSQLSVSATFPVTASTAPTSVKVLTTPVVTPPDGSLSLATYVATSPSTGAYAGYYELRLKSSAAARAGTITYDSAYIVVNGGNWSVGSLTPVATVVPSVSPSSVTSGQSVTYSVTVTGGTGTPTGKVDFTIGSTALCTITLSTSGAGSCSASNAPVGTDTVTASYGGNGTYPASSGTTSLTVSTPPTTTTTAPPPTTTTTTTPPAAPKSGYDLVGSDGGVFVFPTGQSGGYYGSLPGLGVSVNDVVGMVPTANYQGYFLVGRDGGVFAFGNATYEGSLPGLGVSVHNIVGIVPSSDDKGYFLVGSDGGVFAFGDAAYEGSLPGSGVATNSVVGIASTPDNHGYWVVLSTGQVYNFGTAGAYGSASSTSPISGIAGTPDGKGYWLVAQNGGVYAFGDAVSYGSLPALGVSPNKPIVGIVPTADQKGYWLIGADGGVFAFGDAPSVGSLPGLGLSVSNVVGAVPTQY